MACYASAKQALKPRLLEADVHRRNVEDFSKSHQFHGVTVGETPALIEVLSVTLLGLQKNGTLHGNDLPAWVAAQCLDPLRCVATEWTAGKVVRKFEKDCIGGDHPCALVCQGPGERHGSLVEVVPRIEKRDQVGCIDENATSHVP